VKVPKPDHRYTFSGAKTAATFSQLSGDKCAFVDPIAALEPAPVRKRSHVGPRSKTF
jgi:hypothetical protein